MTIAGIRRLYAHMDWADQRLLTLLSAVALARTESAIRLFSHVLAAERVWLLRLRGEDSGVQAIWPDLSLEELHAMAAANQTGYAHYLDRLRDDAVASEVAYTNQQGHPYRVEVGDILIHVAMHGSYHRGQIAAAIRSAGAEPVNTDYIMYVRENPGGAR